MSNLTYKVILKTSHKHVGRIQNCLDTWLGGLDYVCLTDKLTGNFEELSGSENDSYYSNEEKTIHLINLVRETGLYQEYDWLVFIDDDAILNTKYFNYILPYLDKTRFYGLAMGGYPKDPNLVFASGGAGYFISPEKVRTMKAITKPGWSTGGTEDVIVGYWLQQNNVGIYQEVEIEGKQHHFEMNGWWPFHREKDLLTEQQWAEPTAKQYIIESLVDDTTKDFLLKHITHHYIKERYEMEYVYSVLKDWIPEYL